MSRQIKILLLLLILTFSIPYIKILMIYLGIFQLMTANLIKATLLDILNIFSLTVPNVMLILIAEIFWPFIITVSIQKLFEFLKKKPLLHPVATAASLWVILNGSIILIS
jgi:hypothetical protein